MLHEQRDETHHITRIKRTKLSVRSYALLSAGIEEIEEPASVSLDPSGILRAGLHLYQRHLFLVADTRLYKPLFGPSVRPSVRPSVTKLFFEVFRSCPPVRD